LVKIVNIRLPSQVEYLGIDLMYPPSEKVAFNLPGGRFTKWDRFFGKTKSLGMWQGKGPGVGSFHLASYIEKFFPWWLPQLEIFSLRLKTVFPTRF